MLFARAMAQLGAGRAADARATAELLRARRRLTTAAGAAAIGAAPGDLWSAAADATLTVHASELQDATRLWTAKLLVLWPDAGVDPSELPSQAELKLPALSAAVQCRAGRFDRAAERLAVLSADDPYAALFLALAEHGRGRFKEARQALDDAGRWLDAPSTPDARQTNYARLPWNARVEIDVLRREIEEKLAKKGAD
jgi:hypothetical protein